MLSKMELRDIVIINKKAFEDTGNNEYIFTATVYYAVYRAINGAKLIPLPPFTDSVFNTVYNIALIKSKLGKEVTKEVFRKASNNLISQMPEIRDIEYINSFDNDPFIKIHINGAVYSVKIYKDSTKMLSNLALIIIKSNGLNINKKFVYKIVYEALSCIGRG